jgi:hypothetical protein
MENNFKWLSIEHIERNKNTERDELAKIIAQKTTLSPYVFQTIEDSLVKTTELDPTMVNVIQGEDWRVPIMVYLHHHYELDKIGERL